jgi:hypothetical protein
MNDRERTLAILNYRDYDRMPLVHFGYWDETLEKWAAEGHITPQEAVAWKDGNPTDAAVSGRLGFDFNWATTFGPNTRLYPEIEERVLERLPDGSRKVLNKNGAVVIKKEGAAGIPPEVDHLLKGREEWERFFLPRLQYTRERLSKAAVKIDGEVLSLDRGGLERMRGDGRRYPLGLYCGSLYGVIRDFVGLVDLAYLQKDEPALFEEMIETVGELCYATTQAALETGARFDFGHMWEDICFKSGPLVNPRVFRERVGPHYRRITELLQGYGIGLVSLDCDGKIDALLPIWLENGVNVMFPIEVGTWGASIAPWRAQYGRELRGVGGMDKRAFARDYGAIDDEIARLKPLVALGGYIPCPDHRLAPDARWENVQYYCERMRETFA